MKKLTVGSCFSGIGGIEKGLEDTGGFETKWQCENDPFCLQVLFKHWPNVEKYGDIRDVQEFPKVDVICGGFPCQDISIANDKRTGLEGHRSGLWSELLRAIRLVRPRYAIVENVPNILNLGLGTVLGDLAEEGYDSEYDCLSSHELGASHRRLRMFLIAYPASERRTAPSFFSREFEKCKEKTPRERVISRIISSGIIGGRNWAFPDTATIRVPDGLPNWTHRLRGLGNSVDPRRARKIGEMILKYEASLSEVKP